MIQISQILQGWANVAKDKLGLLDPALKQEAEKKLLICNECPMRTGNSCDPNKQIMHETKGVLVKGCGCNLTAKILSNSACPAGKW